MYQYASVAAAIEDLRERGFSNDFNLKDSYLVCNEQAYAHKDFEILEVYRFEGDSDPGDEAIVLGIESNDGIRGILVNGYGYSSEPMADEMMRKLSMHAS
jgi:hypothetical protein